MKTASADRYISTKSGVYWQTIFVIFLGSMAAFGAEYCVQPLIPAIARDFALTPVSGSIAVSAGLLGMALAMLFIAVIGPRLDRKRVTAFALMLSALITIGIGFCANFHLIVAMRFLQGVILAAFPTLMIAYINEEFEPSSVGSVLGIYIGGNALGGLAGRLAVSAFTDFFDWRTGLMCIGVIYLIIGALVLFMLPKPKFVRPAYKGHLKIGSVLKNMFSDKRLLLVYLIALCAMGSFVAVYNFITYVLLHPPYNLSQTAIGFIFVTYLFGSVSSAVMGRKTDTWGNAKVILVSVCAAIAGLVISLLPPLWGKIAGLILFTCGFFGCHTAACGWVGKLNKGDKAISSSLYMFFYYTGASSLGSLAGIFLQHWGWPGVVAMVCCAEALCLALLAGVKRSLNNC